MSSSRNVVYIGNRAFSKKPTNSGRGIGSSSNKVFIDNFDTQARLKEQEREYKARLKEQERKYKAEKEEERLDKRRKRLDNEYIQKVTDRERERIRTHNFNELDRIIEEQRNILAYKETGLADYYATQRGKGKGIGSSRNAVAPDEAPRGQMRYVRVAPRRGTPPLGGMEVQFSPEELARLAALRADRARLAALGIQLQGTSNSLENIWR